MVRYCHAIPPQTLSFPPDFILCLESYWCASTAAMWETPFPAGHYLVFASGHRVIVWILPRLENLP